MSRKLMPKSPLQLKCDFVLLAFVQKKTCLNFCKRQREYGGGMSNFVFVCESVKMPSGAERDLQQAVRAVNRGGLKKKVFRVMHTAGIGHGQRFGRVKNSSC